MARNGEYSLTTFVLLLRTFLLNMSLGVCRTMVPAASSSAAAEFGLFLPKTSRAHGATTVFQ